MTFNLDTNVGNKFLLPTRCTGQDGKRDRSRSLLKDEKFLDLIKQHLEAGYDLISAWEDREGANHAVLIQK